MRFDLIALDLDDTLLHTDLSISAANVAALREAHRQGSKIVLASGRTIHSMEKYAVQLGLAGDDDYIIASNGAEIVATKGACVLKETLIAPALCHEIVAAIEARGHPWQVYMGGRILYRGARNRWTDQDTRLSGMPGLRIDDVEGILSGGQLKFLVPGDPDVLPGLLAELAGLFEGRVEVLTSKPYFLEVLALGVDKGRALADLAAMLDIPLESTLAMGDAMNDLGMLRKAGLSCAPANATPAVKAAADWVSALSNDEDFVADALARHVLGKTPA